MKIERPKRNIEHSNRNLSQILCGGNGQGGLHAQLKLKRQAWKSLLLNSNYSSCLTLISPPTVQWISAFVLFITVCDLCSSCTPCSVDARAQVHDGSFLTKCLLLMAVLSLCSSTSGATETSVPTTRTSLASDAETRRRSKDLAEDKMHTHWQRKEINHQT